MSDTVIREVVHGIWTFSRPFTRIGIVPVGGRSTAIKLRSGGVWVLASTPLSAETKIKIDELGPVQYIIGADKEHTLFLGEFKKAYPSAKLILPESALPKLDPSVKADGAWGRDPSETKYGFENEIQHCYFSGFQNKDVAFLHNDSKTLVEADLLFNLPCTEQYSKSTSSGRIPLIGDFIGPESWLYPKLTWPMGTDKDAMRRDVKTVMGWNFDRIIPCHGDVIETGGKKAWADAFKFYIDGANATSDE